MGSLPRVLAASLANCAAPPATCKLVPHSGHGARAQLRQAFWMKADDADHCHSTHCAFAVSSCSRDATVSLPVPGLVRRPQEATRTSRAHCRNRVFTVLFNWVRTVSVAARSSSRRQATHGPTLRLKHVSRELRSQRSWRRSLFLGERRNAPRWELPSLCLRIASRASGQRSGTSADTLSTCKTWVWTSTSQQVCMQSRAPHGSCERMLRRRLAASWRASAARTLRIHL